MTQHPDIAVHRKLPHPGRVERPRKSDAPPPLLMRIAGNTFIGGTLLAAKALAQLGLKRRPDGWRRATSVGLRSEGSKFILSAFGLDLWSDLAPTPDAPEPTPEAAQRHFVRRFADFLRADPVVLLELEHTNACATPHARAEVDVTLAEFGPTGELVGFVPFFDPFRPLAMPREDVLRGRVMPAILGAYNELRQTWDDRPPPDEAFVPAELDGSPAAPGAARAFVHRVVGSTFVSFEEPVDGALRFTPPDFLKRRGLSSAPLNVACRLSRDNRSVDVWVQVHHAALDGAPAQEMLNRLDAAWGIAAPAVFPRQSEAPTTITVCSTPAARRKLLCVQDAIDFSPLLELRNELSAREDIRLAGRVGICSMLLWCLAHQQAFLGKTFAIAVDVPPKGDHERSVALLPIRPSDFFCDLRPSAGFAAFIHEFERQVSLTRKRRNETTQLLDTGALLPPWMQVAGERLNPLRNAETFGTIGLTILRDAKVFVSPMVDVGFEDGFIAIGNMQLPAEEGTTVGFATMKAPDRRVETYPDALRQAVRNCRNYF